MPVRPILQLGNPALYAVCERVEVDERDGLSAIVEDLHETLMDFRLRFGAGRAIAAPQIGVKKRIVYMLIDEPVVIINPVIDQKSEDLFELWDDCMSFPDLFVRVCRHQSCRITFRDLDWAEQTWVIEGDLSELLQHECDHLDGILAVARAVDAQAFALRGQIPNPARRRAEALGIGAPQESKQR